MKTLFIDSSRKSLSIALANENKLLFVSNVNSYSKHSNYLMSEIASNFEKIGISVNDIDNIVVLNGPGSFTGIRVGVTIAKTLAWTLNKKLYLLNNLEAIKANIENEIVISTIYDKSLSSYVGIYSEDSKIEDYLLLESDLLNINNKNITIVYMEENEFVSNLKTKLENNNNITLKKIEEYNYLKVIENAMMRGDINPHLAEPIYLKKIDAEKKNGN